MQTNSYFKHCPNLTLLDSVIMEANDYRFSETSADKIGASSIQHSKSDG